MVMTIYECLTLIFTINSNLQEYICQVFPIYSQKNTLFQINAYACLHTYHHTQKMDAPHRPVMQALQQDQVPQGQEWRILMMFILP